MPNLPEPQGPLVRPGPEASRRDVPLFVAAAVAVLGLLVWHGQVEAGRRPGAARIPWSAMSVMRSGRRTSVPPAAARAPNFKLVDSRGRPFRRSDLRGPWVAAFVFSRCAGQCPMMAARMRELSQRLPALRLVSFSLDPQDTPARLRDYARSQGARWTFLTGRGAEVRRLCLEGFKLPVDDAADPREPILHSNRLVLVDGTGGIRGYFDAADPAALSELTLRAEALLGPARRPDRDRRAGRDRLAAASGS